MPFLFTLHVNTGWLADCLLTISFIHQRTKLKQRAGGLGVCMRKLLKYNGTKAEEVGNWNICKDESGCSSGGVVRFCCASTVARTCNTGWVSLLASLYSIVLKRAGECAIFIVNHLRNTLCSGGSGGGGNGKSFLF